MVSIKERKIGEDGQLVGYLLERDGLLFVVSLRDLYDEGLVQEFISAGYKYHSYYGDISNESGILINELSSSVLTPEDNTSFMGCFESSALSEWQMAQYMSLNMNNVQEVEFRKPVKIVINTREELLAYLNKFKKIDSQTTSIGLLMPINAICNPDALFTIEELEDNVDLTVYLSYMSRRRTFISRDMIYELQQFFIQQGLLTEDELDNPDLLVKAWYAWGPEGIKTKCIEKRYLQDVIFPCDVTYSGTGQEELTFESKAKAIAHKVTSTTLSGVDYSMGYGLMDKDGTVYYNGKSITANDIISNRGNILLTDDIQQQYNKNRRDADKWKKPYKIIDVCEIKHKNRVCFTLQIETGQLYQYRADRDVVALVSTHGRIFSSGFASVRLENGSNVSFSTGFNKDVIVDQIVFRTLVTEMISDIVISPPFKSTVEMCESCGMHYEQIIDYIEYLNKRKEATPVLHDSLPQYFYNVFGDGLSELDESANLFDKLDILSNSIDSKTDPESNDYINFDAIITDMSKINSDIWNAAIYVMEDNPLAKFNAVLDFSYDSCSGEQYAGRVSDSKEGLISPLIALMRSAYFMRHEKYEPNSLLQEINNIRDGVYFDIKDKIYSLMAEYNGSLADHGMLNLAQLSTAHYSCWVMGVVNEISGKPMRERRHLAFFGWKMDISKGTGIRKIINRMIRDIEMDTKRDETYYLSKDNIECTRSFFTFILKLIWQIRCGSMMMTKNENGEYVYTASRVDSVNFKHSVDITITNSEYNYITNPACPDFTVFMTTLYEWCRYSMDISMGALSFYAITENVSVNPWYVNVKSGYPDIPVYSGVVNLISTDIWNTVYKEKSVELYNNVMRVSGRTPVCLVDGNIPNLFSSTNNDFVDLEIFKAENARLGKPGNMLPTTMIDYYTDPEKTENLQNYYRRASYYVSKSKEGNRMGVMPLKSDYYYDAIAVTYGYESSTTTTYGNYDRPSADYTPYMLSYDNSIERLSVNQARLYRFKDYKFDSADLAQCSTLIMGEFKSSSTCYVGSNVIVLSNGVRKYVDNIKQSDMVDLVDAGCSYQVNATTFIVYAMNGAFVCEV